MTKPARSILILLTLTLVTTAMTACVSPRKLLGNPETPYAPPRVPEVGDILHVKTGTFVDEEAMLATLTDTRVVYVGETHDNPASHRLQLTTLRALQQRWPNQVALGMEMFTPAQQEVLDAWTAGKLSEREFLKQVEWFNVWSMDFDLYRDLLEYTRDHQIPVVGLNVDKELRREVGRTPLEVLSPESRARLPEMDLADPYQRGLVEAIFGGHDAGQAMFDGFLRVQTLWDESMAENAANYLSSKSGQDKHLMIVAGGNHIRYGFGIPRRLFRRLPTSYTTVGGREIVIPESKQDRQMDVTLPKFPFPPYDYLVYTAYEDLPDAETKVKLGVHFEETDAGLELKKVISGSAAADAGLREGDILTSVDGEPLTERFDLLYPLSLKRSGDSIILGLYRGDEQLELSVSLAPLRLQHPSK